MLKIKSCPNIKILGVIKMLSSKHSSKKHSAFEYMQEKLEMRRRKASLSRLITYVILLIVVIMLMIWLKRM